VLRFIFFGIFFLGLISSSALGREGVDIAGFFEQEGLIVSNYPEEIRNTGLVFREKMKMPAVRVVYYHKNGSNLKLGLNLVVKNMGKQATKVRYITAVTGPSKHEVYVGYKYTKLYFQKLLGEKVLEVDLGPGQSKLLSSKSMSPGYICGGIVRVEREAGAELEMKMQVVDADFPQLSVLEPSAEFNLARFDFSYKQIDLVYDCNRLKEIAIGQYPFFEDAVSNIVLKGNYGFLYKINIILANDSLQHKKINLLFLPSGGIIKGVVLINNKLLETKFFKDNYFESEKIYEVNIKPKENKNLELFVMPQAGSFYPVNIVLNNMREIRYN
jgi:hypothetical protein